MNVNSEAENLYMTGSIQQVDNSSFRITTLHCVIDDAASDDRAEKCYFTVHHHYHYRRRFLALQATKTNAPCEYTNA